MTRALKPVRMSEAEHAAERRFLKRLLCATVLAQLAGGALAAYVLFSRTHFAGAQRMPTQPIVPAAAATQPRGAVDVGPE